MRRAESGQSNKQRRMEEEANRLYRRPQMTGQARDEDVMIGASLSLCHCQSLRPADRQVMAAMADVSSLPR